MCASQLVAVMLFVYGDESMDETRQRVCAVAGVGGTDKQWRALERQWPRRTNGLPFHANHCDSDQGDYANRPHWENKNLYRDLAIMLANSGLVGFGQAIDLVAKQTVFPDSEDLAYYTAFTRVVMAMKNHALGTGQIAEFTFDTRMESEHNAEVLYGSLREHEPDWAPYIASKISFELAKDNSRIQVADLVAREAMKALDNLIGPKKRLVRKSWQALLDTGRFAVDAFSVEWFEDMKRKLPAFATSIGVERDGYVAWLKARKRQHNVSNMFYYVDWTARRDKGKVQP